MYRDLNEVIASVQNKSSKQESDYKRWQSLKAVNRDYMHKEGLDKQLKFGRTIYIPYNKVLVISGERIGSNKN